MPRRCAPFVKERKNLIVLHSICSAYGKTPGEYLQLESPWARWQVDEVTLLAGRQAEREAQGDTSGRFASVGKGKSVGYRSAASGRNVKKVKIKPNGTW